MPKYTDDEMKSRTEFSQRVFHQIERSLSDFIDHVPLDHNHLEVYSLKLVTAILETGPEIISSFELAVSELAHSVQIYAPTFNEDIGKLWEKEQRLRRRKKSLTFSDYYSFLEKHMSPKLSNATIQIRGFDAYMMPFEEAYPKWWENYNLLKHDKYNSLSVATLRYALKASGALFWLVGQNSKRFDPDKPDSELFVITQLLLDSSLKKI